MAAVLAGVVSALLIRRRVKNSGTALHSAASVAAAELMEWLQLVFVRRLERIDPAAAPFRAVEWARCGGAHGGGKRYQTSHGAVFNRASVNVSAVHFESRDKYPIDSATAFSVILHPSNPHAPSMHFHASVVEPRRGGAYWRMIADLNPSIVDAEATVAFEAAVQGADGLGAKLHAASVDFGSKYFYIAPLARHRGAAHFFAASVTEEEMDALSARRLARSLATRVIDVYARIVERAASEHPPAVLRDDERAAQLAYHTVYFFQVLMLDRGTTYGVLAHADNDVGTLGSLPSVVDCALLASWRCGVAEPQGELLDAALAALAPTRGAVTDDVRQALAFALRAHYKAHPEAKALQAEWDFDAWKERAQARIGCPAPHSQ
jgi:coproporphyrinogen III oxidase